MVKPRAYMDTCCFIEVVKGRLGRETTHSKDEIDFIELLLRAARDGVIEIYTSLLTVSEFIHAGEKPPTDQDKDIIHRLMMSGRDGILLVQQDPFVTELSRNLFWDDGLNEKAPDRIHVASALFVEAKEIYSLDGKLAEKVGQSAIRGCKIISPKETTILPNEYRQNDLLAHDKKE